MGGRLAVLDGAAAHAVERHHARQEQMDVVLPGEPEAAEPLDRARPHAVQLVGRERLRHRCRAVTLAVVAGVRDLPTRVKGAILPWHTLQAAFNSVASTSTEAAQDPMHAPIGNA